MNQLTIGASLRNWAAVFMAGCIATIQAKAQVTAFTFQGRLSDNGVAANGTYDLRFSLFNTNANGSPLAGPLTNSTVSADNGIFSAVLDFGANVFDGTPRWLEIGVRTNGGIVPYTTLNPRQFISAAPYAISAATISGHCQMRGSARTWLC